MLVLNNLNPIAIRVQNEGDVLHASICKPLLPVDIQRLETRTRSVQIINRNAYQQSLTLFPHQPTRGGELTDMTKALGLTVSVVVTEVLVLLGAIVPRQFQQALAVSGTCACRRLSLLSGVS